MSEKNAAVETLRRLAVQWQGITEAADQLEAVGRAEDTVAELKAEAAKLHTENEQASKDLKEKTATLLTLENEIVQAQVDKKNAEDQRDEALQTLDRMGVNLKQAAQGQPGR